MPNRMERFTVRARRVLSLAQEEAERLEHGYIGSEHLLLGLMREEGGVASRVLRDLGLELRRVEELAEQMTHAGWLEPGARLDLSPDTKKALELAVDEARRMNHHYIGTEHLLLGLVRQNQGVAIDVLKRLNVSPEEVRRLTRRVLQEAPLSRPHPATPTVIYPPLAGQIVVIAREEAEARGHRYVGAYHLLLALLSGDQVSTIVLGELGLQKLQVEEALQREAASDVTTDNPLDLTPEVKRTIDAAITDAISRKSRFVSSLDLLSRLLRDHRHVFEQLHLDPDTLWFKIEALFAKQPPASKLENAVSQPPLSKETRMDEKDIYRAILDVQEKGQPAAVATVIRGQGSLPRHVGSKMLVFPDGHIVGTVGGGGMESRVIEEARAVIQSGQATIVSYTLNNPSEGDPGVCGGSAEIFIEPLVILPTLVVVGCGHVGKALAAIAKWTGFRVIVSDDRAEFCNPEHIPNMDGYIVCPAPELPKHLTPGPQPQTYVASVSRGVSIDADLLPPLLELNLPYLGVIGSKRRWTLTLKTLQERGFTAEQLARVHAPIGLELQAETPQEIAISIMAEITMIRRGGTGQPMQYTPPPNLSE